MRNLGTFGLALLCACGSSTPTAPAPGSDAALDADLDATAPPAEDSAVAADSGPDPTFDAAVYTLPKQKFSVPRVGDAIDAALAAHPGTDNIVFYVHGRSCGGGGEPDKSLGGVMPEIEKDYTAAAIMFFWPGSDDGCPLGFPEAQARASGPALRFMLARVQAWVKSHPGKLAGVGLSLLAHSMGNIVLESALGPGSTGLDPSLFGTVVLNSSATALAKHATWLQRVDFASRVYVTVNDGDKVLLAAGAGRGTRLGKQLETEPLTARAAYVDFTLAGVNHQYYVASGQKGVHMGEFYGAVLAGKAYDFSSSKAIDHTQTRDGATIHFFDGK